VSDLLKSTNLILLQRTAYVGWMATKKMSDLGSEMAKILGSGMSNNLNLISLRICDLPAV
jgi:hypothetical protein